MKKLLIGAALVLLALVGMGVSAVMSPPAADQTVGNALVVHAGGRGERLTSGLALMANGAAPVMVIMNGTAPEWPKANGLCDQIEPFIVFCPTPQPDNTVGEASALGELIDEQKWISVVVVTSDYHLRRTMILDRACAGTAMLRGVAAPADISTVRRIALITREVVALSPRPY